jgi:hypothetical protein
LGHTLSGWGNIGGFIGVLASHRSLTCRGDIRLFFEFLCASRRGFAGNKDSFLRFGLCARDWESGTYNDGCHKDVTAVHGG